MLRANDCRDKQPKTPREAVGASSRRWRAKNFFLTYSQCGAPKEEMMAFLRGKWEEETSYILVGQEEHKEVGSHLHVFITFMNTHDMRARDFDFPREGDVFHPNIQVARCVKDVVAYVKKDGNWMDWGVDPVMATKMTRIEKMNFIRTHDIDDILASGHFGVAEMNAALRLKQQMKVRERQWPDFQKRRVFWFYRGTGRGKTRLGMRIMRGTRRWVKLNGSLRTFINGYNGQDGVLIDDLRAGSIDFETLLSILDGYPTFVNVKGGIEEWLATTIVITAPKRPEEVFYDHQREQPWDKVDQLLRRIDVLRDFDEKPYGTEAGDVTTVVLPEYGPEPEPTPTLPAPEELSPQEAVLIPEETLSDIPGSLNRSVLIVNGSVVPKN